MEADDTKLRSIRAAAEEVRVHVKDDENRVRRYGSRYIVGVAHGAVVRRVPRRRRQAREHHGRYADAPRTAVGVARYPVPEARGARGGSRLRFRGASLRRIKRGFNLNRGARELFGQGSGSWLAPGHARRRVRHRRLRFAQLPDAHGYHPALPAARASSRHRRRVRAEGRGQVQSCIRD